MANYFSNHRVCFFCPLSTEAKGVAIELKKSIPIFQFDSRVEGLSVRRRMAGKIREVINKFSKSHLDSIDLSVISDNISNSPKLADIFPPLVIPKHSFPVYDSVVGKQR